MQIVLSYVTVILNFVGYIPYIRDILRKKVRPHPITWAIWTILTTIAAFNQVKNGGGYSSLFFISTAFLVAITFLLSLRYGMGGASRLDRFCLILAGFLLLFWLTTHDTHISTVVAVAIDAIGALPTVVKTYHHPGSETYIQWSLAGIAGLLTLFAVPRFDWILIIYPLYVFLMNGIIVGIKYFREQKE